MRFRFPVMLLVVCPLLVAMTVLCSRHNPEAPLPGQPHPQGFTHTHGAEAAADLAGCIFCHGADFRGTTGTPSCFACHADGPPFFIHPAAWGADILTNHRQFYTEFSWTTCATAACHGTDLRGAFNGPSCFTIVDCHGGGPPAPASHDQMPFTSEENHGPEARSRQLLCRNCHGRPLNIFDGGFVADQAILNKPNGNCMSCHPAATAHPTQWLEDHRGFNTPSCPMCHRTTEPGPGPFPGAPSCFSPSFTNADGLTGACHSGGSSPGHAFGAAWININHPGPSLAGDPPCFNCHRQEPPPGLIEPSCQDCHTAASPLDVGNCRSCHNDPPDGGALAGDVRPNRAGRHEVHVVQQGFICSVCHFQRGSGTIFHFDFEAPADVNFDRNVTGGDINFVQEQGNTACAGVCHGEAHVVQGLPGDHRWY